MLNLGKMITATALFTTLFQVSAMDKVVYGSDNRLDWYEVVDSQYLELARSTAAMIPNHNFEYTDDGIKLQSKKLESRGICKSARFSQQMTASNCSGFLVAEDIMVTAGHCIQSMSDCRSNTWVFDFAVETEGQTEFSLPSENVYKCKSIIERQLNSENGNDYAVIKLQRKVVGRTPLTLRTSGKVESGEDIVVIGHPTGLPSKISDNAYVRKNSDPISFSTNLDTFGGNSGSAVFNAETGVVEGVLVRGEQDYEYDYEKGCRVPKKCSETGCRGEDVTRITNLKKLMKMLR